jgi:hypothetical protein
MRTARHKAGPRQLGWWLYHRGAWQPIRLRAAMVEPGPVSPV